LFGTFIFAVFQEFTSVFPFYVFMHRNNHGNRLMFEILIAPPDTARAMLNSAGVRYIAICDAYNKGAVITAKSPAGLSSALAKEMTPDWLRPIKLETPVKVYEVAAAP
jgi:hypothetical protein